MTNEELLYPLILDLDAKKEVICWRADLDPRQPMLNFFDIRKTPDGYVQAELQWYLSKDLHVAMIAERASMWKAIASSRGLINSNYGWCIFSDENYNQYDEVVSRLKRRPQTKQGQIIYTRPSMQKDAFENGMKDFICTAYTQHFIREDELIYIVHQRSCDFVYGFFNDFYWHCWVYEKMLKDLRSSYAGLSYGPIVYMCDTIHIYPKHYELISRIAENIKRGQNGSNDI